MKGISARKSLRHAERRRVINRSRLRSVRTLTRRALEGVLGTETDRASAVVKQASIALDRAAARGIVHRNLAARRKSRLMMRLNQTILAETARG